jgi:hypothetical protein
MLPEDGPACFTHRLDKSTYALSYSATPLLYWQEFPVSISKLGQLPSASSYGTATLDEGLIFIFPC